VYFVQFSGWVFSSVYREVVGVLCVFRAPLPVAGAAVKGMKKNYDHSGRTWTVAVVSWVRPCTDEANRAQSAGCAVKFTDKGGV
jgi:hypothetical protein